MSLKGNKKNKRLIFRYRERYPDHDLTEEKMEAYLNENEEDTEFTYNNHITSGMYKIGAGKPL